MHQVGTLSSFSVKLICVNTSIVSAQYLCIYKNDEYLDKCELEFQSKFSLNSNL